MKKFRLRRLAVVLVSFVGLGVALLGSVDMWQQIPKFSNDIRGAQSQSMNAREALDNIEVKGRAPKTGYTRTQFGDGWAKLAGCDMRNAILYRDLDDVVVGENCLIESGNLHDPYTDKTIAFERGAETSQLVQIDHVVALSNAWQTGAQALTQDQRITLANDVLNLLAVDGAANQQKSDSDAASWLPPHKPFRCQYVARQIAIKQKYSLWVTPAEKDAMIRVLDVCPSQLLPTEGVGSSQAEEK